MVVKPAEQTPLTALYLGSLIKEVRHPERKYYVFLITFSLLGTRPLSQDKAALPAAQYVTVPPAYGWMRRNDWCVALGSCVFCHLPVVTELQETPLLPRILSRRLKSHDRLEPTL